MRSRCRWSGSSPASQSMEIVGEDLKAPVHRRNPWFWIGFSVRRAASVAELYIGEQ